MAFAYPLPAKFNAPVLLFGKRKRSFPLDHDQGHFVVEGEYLQKKQFYVREKLGTLDTEYPTARLVYEDIVKEEAESVWFVRRYATIPQSWDDASTYSYDFIGLYGGRGRITMTVLARIHHEYFENQMPFHPTKGIPLIPLQRYTNATLGGDVDTLSDGGGALFPTTPTLSAYLEWCAQKKEVVPEDSALERYMGNIWVRKTIYIVAR